jgi:8-oxo-dGTP diphosphatase
MSSNADGAMSQSTEAREYPERPILAVGGVVIHEGRVLLIRRGQPPMEGRWSIPGGIVELGETIADAVMRELKEETGIGVRVLDLIEIYEKVTHDEASAAQYHFVILDYRCEFVEGTAAAGGDVTEVTWATEQQMESLGLTAAAKRVIQKAFSAARGRAAHQT